MPFARFLLLMMGMYLAGAISTLVYNRLMMMVSTGTLNRMRKDMFLHMEDLPIRYFDQRTHGEIMSRYTNDTDTLREFLSQSFPQAISSLFSILFSLFYMIRLNVWLTLLVIALMPVMLFATGQIGKHSGKNFAAQQKAVGALNGYIEETIEGQKVIKVFNHEGETIDRFNLLNGNLRRSATSANTFASILMPIMGNLSYINYAVLCVFGGFLVIVGNTTVGAISSFLLFSKQFTQPITNLSQQFNNILSALAGAERIFDIIDAEKEEDNGYVLLVNAYTDENGEIREREIVLEENV
jgi:ATP-binding cassette subfamily B protein